jgi:hypothetical protein
MGGLDQADDEGMEPLLDLSLSVRPIRLHAITRVADGEGQLTGRVIGVLVSVKPRLPLLPL